MENLVEDIIYTDYENLKDIELIMNKRFGLVVYKDDIRYEFLLNLLDSSDKLIVLGSGALGRDNVKFDRSQPIFSRWSWTLPESMINYNDPTLYLHKDIVSPWGVGTSDNWYLKNISLIIKIISEKLNVPNNKIIFSGSSAGGFTSLLLSVLVKDSIAYAEIPQFDIVNWRDYFKDFQKYCFNDESFPEIIEKWGHRLSFIKLVIKEDYIPNAYIYLDCSSNYDFKNQYLPFFKELDKIKYDDDFNKLKLIIYGQNKGHDHFDVNVYKKLLDKIISDIDLNSEISKSQNFKIIGSNESQITYSNGENIISVVSFPNLSVIEMVNEYMDEKNNENQTVYCTTLDMSNNFIFRTILYVKNVKYVNYWFEKDNTVYQYHCNPITNEKYEISHLDDCVSFLINCIDNDKFSEKHE